MRLPHHHRRLQLPTGRGEGPLSPSSALHRLPGSQAAGRQQWGFPREPWELSGGWGDREGAHQPELGVWEWDLSRAAAYVSSQRGPVLFLPVMSQVIWHQPGWDNPFPSRKIGTGVQVIFEVLFLGGGGEGRERGGVSD